MPVPMLSANVVGWPVEVVPRDVPGVQADEVYATGSEVRPPWPEWRTDPDLFPRNDEAWGGAVQSRGLQALLVEFGAEQDWLDGELFLFGQGRRQLLVERKARWETANSRVDCAGYGCVVAELAEAALDVFCKQRGILPVQKDCIAIGKAQRMQSLSRAISCRS